MEDFDLKALNAEVSNGGLEGKNLPKRLKILNWGKNDTTQGPIYLNDKTVKVFAENQKERGRDIDVALDFNHNTVPGSVEYVKGAPTKIAAYGKPKLVKGDGLYLEDLEWTPDGKEYAKGYKDLSPAVKTDAGGTVEWLHSAALTPNGAIQGLKFYSVQMENMIKDYNKGGANAGVKQVGDHYEAVTSLDADTKADENGILHDAKCECAKCMDADEAEDVSMMAADDHFSKYGDVKYADAENHKYPIDTKEHVKAAWSYINMPKNAEKEQGKISTIKSNIKAAAKKFGIDIKDECADNKNTDTKIKAMSANNPSFPDAYKAQPSQYNTMNDSIIKKMAAEVGLDNESDEAKVLYAFLAKYEGLKAEIAGQINHKSNTEEGGLKQFASKIEALETELKAIKTGKVNDERSALIAQASKEGKVIPLSADSIKTVDLAILKDIVANAPKNVPMNAQLRVLSVDNGKKATKETAIAKFNEMVASAK